MHESICPAEFPEGISFQQNERLFLFTFRSRPFLRQSRAFPILAAVGDSRETYTDVCPFINPPKSTGNRIQHKLVLTGV